MIIKKAKVVHLNELDGISVAIARTEDGERQLSFRNDKGYEVGREVEVQFDDDYNGFNVVGWCGCPSCTMKRQNDGYVATDDVSKADLVEQIREVYRQNYEAKTRTPDEKALDAVLTDYTGRSLTIGKRLKEEPYMNNPMDEEVHPSIQALKQAEQHAELARYRSADTIGELHMFMRHFIGDEGSAAVLKEGSISMDIDLEQCEENLKNAQKLLDEIKEFYDYTKGE